MTKQLRWSCTACGMSSGRKYSVRRHIENYKIHNGAGNIIPFVEYAIGRREGKYQPMHVRSFRRSSSTDYFEGAPEKIARELENEIIKAAAIKLYNDTYRSNPKMLDNLVNVARVYIDNIQFTEKFE